MQAENSYKYIWKISYPIILGGVAQTVINVTDTAFMGRVSEVAIGASAIAALFYVTFYILGFGFSIGAQILIARLDGEKNHIQIGKVFSHTLYFLLMLATVVFVFLKWFSPAVLNYFVSSKAVLQASLDYIDYRAWGIFFAFIGLAIRSFFVGISNTRIVIYTTLISAISNIILNYIFVFGNESIEPMGIGGSALASSLSEVLATLFAIFYVYRKKGIEIYKLFPFSKLNTTTVKQILNMAVPIMFQSFIALFSWFVFFMIVEQMGERPLAISNLVRNVYMVLMIPLMGFGSATNTLVSNAIGQGYSKPKVFQLINKIMFFSFALTLAITLLNMLMPELVLSIFTNDAELIKQTIPSLWIISGSIQLFALTNVLLCSVSGTGNTVASLVIEVITILFYLFATYLMAVKWKYSIEWVWSVEYVYFGFMGALSFVYLRYGKWSKG
ncbi:MAG: MATE family efflux transporter [Bacteroidota bacterium]